jgi:hypothetical protein
MHSYSDGHSSTQLKLSRIVKLWYAIIDDINLGFYTSDHMIAKLSFKGGILGFYLTGARGCLKLTKAYVGIYYYIISQSFYVCTRVFML